MREDFSTDALPPVYDLTPAALSVIEAFCAATPLTQNAVTIMGETVELLIESDPDRYFQEAGSQALSVDPYAQAVRDVVRANELLAGAVLVLGHEAVDTLMRSLPDPGPPGRRLMALTHAIVDRGTGLIVSRHGSLIMAKRAWQRRATLQQGGRIELTPWAARHSVVTLQVANAALARRKSAPVQGVTVIAYPNVHRAFGLIAEDAGESPRFEYLVPKEFEHRLGQAEVALGELDEDGFETMALGSPSAVQALIGGDPGRRTAADLLAGFFSDWHPRTHAGVGKPQQVNV